MERSALSNRSVGTTTAATRSAQGAAPAHVTSVDRSGAVAGTARPALAAETSDAIAPAKRARKERGPNWSLQEILVLIDAKKTLFLEELETYDGRELMTPDAGKWLRISAEVMKTGFSPCHRDGPACKSKWNQLIPDYKRIADFFARSGTNEASYWLLTASQRKAEGLPRAFPQDIFYRIHTWYGSRPAILPPHTRDLMSRDDSNYVPPLASTENAEELDDSADGNEDPIAVAEGMEESDDMTASTQSPLMQVGSGKARALLGISPTHDSGTPTTAPKNSLPPGVTPHILSSSDTTEVVARRRSPSTGVRRKSLSGHSLIAEATRATGDAMAKQMKEMANSTCELERSRIDVQLRLFTEQMQYQRERDHRLQDNARLANENAKLAIEKQGEVVMCLAQLSSALSAGLQRAPAVVEGTSVYRSAGAVDRARATASEAGVGCSSQPRSDRPEK